MKLALVTQHYPPHFEGGTESVVRAQARALAARGHDVRVVSGTDAPHRGADVERATVDGLPVAHLPRLADERYDLLLERPRLLALLGSETAGAELVHVHHWSTLSSSTVRELARSAPVVVTSHDLFPTCPRFFRSPPDARIQCPPRGELDPCVRCVAPDAGGIPLERLREQLESRARGYAAELEAARARIAPSRTHARALAELTGVPLGSFRVVPHGLCRELEPVGAPRALREGEPLCVLSFGHRAQAKGTRDLVRALSAANAERPGCVELVLAGAEVEPGFDRELARAAGDLPLEIRGPYGGAELARLAARAHVAAFPSRALESYGLVVDEALALGLPVWAADRGALGERVGGAGLVLPAEDLRAWTAAVLATTSRQHERWGDRVPTVQRTAEDAVRELEVVYREVV